MSGTPADLRAALATAINAVSGWRESQWAPGLFGADPQPAMHKAFAVGIAETATRPAEGRHQVTAAGVLAETIVEIRWAYQLRAAAQVADHAAALGEELLLIKAAVAISRVGGPKVIFERASRDTSQSAWLLGTIRLRILHQLPLA